MANSIFVFRQETDDTRRRKLLLSAIYASELRQGWSWRETMNLNLGKTSFTRAMLDESFSPDLKAAEIVYDKLSSILRIKKGDWIFVPKQPEKESFLILRAAGSYRFKGTIDGDFAHCIPVDSVSIRVCDYKSQSWGPAIRRHLRGIAYSRPVTQVKDPAVLGVFLSAIQSTPSQSHQGQTDDELTSSGTADGGKKISFGTRYERSPRLREEAVRIHGTRCRTCDFDFYEVYGPHGLDYIHVHHIKPLHEGEQTVDPRTDLTVLCPNCHAMIHRNKADTLSPDRLRKMIKARKPTSPG